MAGASLSLLGIKLKLNKLLTIAVLYGSTIYGVRKMYALFGVPLGTHVFILMICFSLLVKLIGKVNLLTSIIASLLSFLLIFWGEAVFLLPVIMFFKMDLIAFINLSLGYTLLAIVFSDVLLIIAFILGYFLNVTLINLNNNKNSVAEEGDLIEIKE